MAFYNPNEYLYGQSSSEQFEFEELFRNRISDVDLYTTLDPFFQSAHSKLLSMDQTLNFPRDIADIGLVTPSFLENTPTTSFSTCSTYDATLGDPTTQEPAQSNRSQSGQSMENPKSFLCDWPNCTRREPFSTKGSLTRHRKTQHTDGPTLKCPKGCDKLFRRKDNLDQHLRSGIHWKV
ncbi:hypothetical protein PENSTE_c001G07728 [Penicillium steckii]|uniref:C2H2-type domain-containing protein n=1 Tax=Penicillium steckii TaxID=303698 RepID=A0A1V6U0Q0_9EURO|nr:hypothetical protein PENSTE_c001G07728 [Penicillium steckii]